MSISATDSFISLVDEALKVADEAVKEASVIDQELTSTRRDMQRMTKSASQESIAKAAAAVAGLGIPAQSISTHEGALEALEKLATEHKKSISELFTDRHGRLIPRKGVDKPATHENGTPSRYAAWGPAIEKAKRAKH